MAEENRSKSQPEIVESEELRLKYLEFVQVAALQAILCFTKAYDYAKDNSGPLKPGVQSIEGTVKSIVGPVFEKIHDVPIELLKFVDSKVDQSVNKLDLPPLVKQVSVQAFSVAQKAPAAARSVALEVKSAGVIETASELAKTAYAKWEPTAKGFYFKYEPVAEHYAASTWHSLNRHPLFAQLAQVVVPKAAYCSEKYNQAVQHTAEKGYKTSSYLPLVPTERIAKIFGGNESKSQLLVSS